MQCILYYKIHCYMQHRKILHSFFMVESRVGAGIFCYFTAYLPPLKVRTTINPPPPKLVSN